MSQPNIPPSLLAAADQAIAETNPVIDGLLGMLARNYRDGDDSHRTVAFAQAVSTFVHLACGRCPDCEAWAGLLAVTLVRLDEVTRHG